MTTPSTAPLVSVVTPVYNSEKHLAECIESVLRQTHERWEYVIVDNCSTDASAAIAERYASRDDRIRVVRETEFLPAVNNWNRALGYISDDSSYCKIVHADDWIFPDCIERMIEVAERHPGAGIVGAYRLEGREVTLAGLDPGRELFDGRQVCRQSLEGGHYFFGTPTSLLIRSSEIRSRQHFYDVDNVHADTEACYEVLRRSEFGFVHQVLTFTRRHPDTGTTFAQYHNTYLIGQLRVLLHHGEFFLGPERAREAIRAHFDWHYRSLAREVWKGRWDVVRYHRRELVRLGIRPNLLAILARMPAALVAAALCPRTLFRRLRQPPTPEFVAGWVESPKSDDR